MRRWQKFGAHRRGSGVSFTVWAPNATAVRVRGDFNGWRGADLHRVGTGPWRLFVSGVRDGNRYRYDVLGADGGWREKADPMAFATEDPPANTSVVHTSQHHWHDQAWLAERARTDWASTPFSVYDLHLGSWSPAVIGYSDLGEPLIEHLHANGFTHVRLLPLAEYPFGESSAYQASSYYAPTARHGDPDDLRRLVDRLHQAGIGVLVDFVPAHFPPDDRALARFDGTALYEHLDPCHGDRGTLMFDFGKAEVRDFLIAAALHWIEEFHVDGLRVAALSSMLYLDYSRDSATNVHGGPDNLEAAKFLRELTSAVRTSHPDALLIAEEATTWPGVTSFGNDEQTPSPLSSVTVDVVIPVLNEERALPGCIEVLHEYLTEWLPCDWVITIVDNASTDGTQAVAKNLEHEWSRVRFISLDERGKGKAVRVAWTNSDADVVAYMDVDLSTGLDAFIPLVMSVAAGHSDVAIGSRLAPGARTVRGLKREAVSLVYNALLKLVHHVHFHDAQCGFKAAKAEVIRPLLRRVEDDTWFFDTELLLLAEYNGLRVLEVPVDWIEDTDTRVHVGSVAATNVRGVFRIAMAKFSGSTEIAELPIRPAPRPAHPDAVVSQQDSSRLRNLIAFGAIGLLATAITLVLYTVFRTWWPALAANLVAVTMSTLFNTEANRRITFRTRPRSLAVAHMQAFLVSGLYLGFTSGALLALDEVVTAPPRWLELLVLLVASMLGTLGRFVLLSVWVFRPQPVVRIPVPRLPDSHA
jgi:putative flippase GtrA